MHSVRAEQNWTGAGLLDDSDQITAEIRMIAVDKDRMQTRASDRVLGGLISPRKLRLKTGHLYHQAQQRGDDFIARENQHVAQQPPNCEGPHSVGNLRTLGPSRAPSGIDWRTG